jgi:hypothetical protein
MSERIIEEAGLGFGHRVGGALFNPGFLSQGCMGRDSGVKAAADAQRDSSRQQVFRIKGV